MESLCKMTSHNLFRVLPDGDIKEVVDMDILDIMVTDTVWDTDMVDTTVWADITVTDTDMPIHTDTHTMENKSFDLKINHCVH